MATEGETSPKAGQTHKRASSAVERMANTYAPEAVKDAMLQAAPHIGAFAEFVAVKIVPAIQAGYAKCAEIYEALQPYHVDDLTPALLGLFICFFGGSYLTLIAAVEAYRLAGWSNTKKALEALYVNALRALEASKKDDEVDDDGDGQSDVQQMLDKGEVDEVMKRKAGIVLRSVNPDEVTDAISAINTGFIAVLATLKIKFAKAITLGSAIGDMLMKPALRFGEPVLAAIMPRDLRKWASVIIKYAVKSAAISFAWMLQRIISAFHSSIRGGLMCSRGVIAYLGKANIIQIDHEETLLDEVAGGVLAFLGFSFQFRYGFSVPFPLNILFMPFSIAEYWLMWMVNSSS